MNYYYLVLCIKYMCYFRLHACLLSPGCTKYIIKHKLLFDDEGFGLPERSK